MKYNENITYGTPENRNYKASSIIYASDENKSNSYELEKLSNNLKCKTLTKTQSTKIAYNKCLISDKRRIENNNIRDYCAHNPRCSNYSRSGLKLVLISVKINYTFPRVP